MNHLPLALVASAAALLAPLPALAQSDAEIAAARDAALTGDRVAWDIAEGLTTEVGPRMAGTEAEARARAWAKARLDQLGFSNVRIEPYMMKTWVRGVETAEIVSPFPQKMMVAALGNSSSTGPGGITAAIAYFPTFADLVAAPAGSLDGKIAYLSHDMHPTQDGSGYSFAGPVRWVGAGIAASKGAIATVIKSVGTDRHRNPHAGGTTFRDGVEPTPAGALSIPDAENLERMLARGKPVKMHLTLTPKWLGQTESGNVIADLPGSDPAAGMIVIACHLDSWDLGTGAIDDASGCGIITAAAKQVMAAGGTRRTIRLLWAGAEEVGVFGGAAYAEAHGEDKHVLAMESDFGADRVWKVDFNLADGALKDRIAQALAPLGISRGTDRAGGGADVGAIIAAQDLAVIDLAQDGLKYFDLHHTPDDTLDKIDPAQLRQNVAAWTATLMILGNAPGELAPQPAKAE
ncbi:MAG: M28 family peptidase [Sphingomonadales bacterium]|nr:M28 family peptidase [Sphingomonadales bacterium]